MTSMVLSSASQFLAALEERDVRIDVALTTRGVVYSRSLARKLIDTEHVKVNSKPVKASYKLVPGDRVEVAIPDPVPLQLEPQEMPVPVLFEDQHIIVLNKPPGLPVHPGAGHPKGTLVNALLAHCTDLSGIGGSLRPGIVHRLDKNTTGVMVAAKNDTAHLELARQLKERSMRRTYRAIVQGVPRTDRGIIEAPIGRHPVDRKKMAVLQSGRQAKTRFLVLERFGGHAYVEVCLDTGRTHQIRVHMAYIGHPVLADPEYGPGQHLTSAFGMERQALHALKINLIHPFTGEPLEFEAPLPSDMERALALLRSGQGPRAT